MSEVVQLSSLLSTFDSSAPALTLLRLAPGVRMIGPPVEGVIAMLVIAGTLYLEIGGAPPRLVRQGELVLVPAGRRSHLAASALTQMTIDGQQCLVRREGWLVADATNGREPALIVGAGRIAGSSPEGLGSAVISPVVKCRIGKRIFALLRAECLQRDAGQAALASALMNACVVQGLRRAIEEHPARSATNSGGRGPIGGALAAIRARPGARHTVDTLADAAGMSRSSFVRHFKRIMRTGPADYVRTVRLEEARAMLDTTDLPIKTIASRAGFPSRSHFSRAFRQTFGRDPSSYRDRDAEG
ncbi:AraC family transcriptional regulator [Sphingomonas sp. HF-S4]|uniref:AraC family transcriptional regulator n=1 Tax=Sphingomonas agrestis TaxID=3080540 RepID=A0ABU3Y8F4_9SPHN|nr:AraC family transcriptional regulator [Sphingomonas sp. HF-S4]MDV3457674.1 AraC family transcriptional regulator [Sphingomonas sp. HF-S4]